MKIIWFKSRKWTGKELDGKLVEFQITYRSGIAQGVGRFLIRGNGVEKMAADIVVPHPEAWHDNYYHLTNSLFEKIEVHPDQTKANFRVSGRFELTDADEVD